MWGAITQSDEQDRLRNQTSLQLIAPLLILPYHTPKRITDLDYVNVYVSLSCRFWEEKWFFWRKHYSQHDQLDAIFVRSKEDTP